jgi:hypothetical protein
MGLEFVQTVFDSFIDTLHECWPEQNTIRTVKEEELTKILTHLQELERCASRATSLLNKVIEMIVSPILYAD